ncbi:MAG: chromate resistance protein [Candidatus Rokubacteria bacterium]|nr:chromate resistance protein [Candidatus Rokubacteria bacterium]
MLILSLPREPSSIRVRAWRRLRALGALALKSGVYVLPARPDTTEQFQWLAQEVQRQGGEATILHVARVENVPDAEIVRRFREARDADYRGLAERYHRLHRALARGGRGRRVREEAERLARELDRLRDIDFFDAPAGEDARRAREQLEQMLAPAPEAPVPRLDDLRGRLWVTRPRPHVDRLASAWFIRRFVDPDARFAFTAPEARPAEAIPFDMAGVELGHHGDRCTFETLLAATGRRDAGLQALAEIVHEADLRDGKYPREEARGLDLAIRGLLAALEDDEAVLAAGLTLFDGLYEVLSGR